MFFGELQTWKSSVSSKKTSYFALLNQPRATPIQQTHKSPDLFLSRFITTAARTQYGRHHDAKLRPAELAGFVEAQACSNVHAQWGRNSAGAFS